MSQRQSTAGYDSIMPVAGFSTGIANRSGAWGRPGQHEVAAPVPPSGLKDTSAAAEVETEHFHTFVRFLACVWFFQKDTNGTHFICDMSS
jgi:hypothetical protein